VQLDDDVAAEFKDAESVNAALRLVAQTAQGKSASGAKATSRSFMSLAGVAESDAKIWPFKEAAE
jgi:hypothetical protein